MAAGEVALVTNVTEYAGPPAASALAAEGLSVLCHSETFAAAEARAAFEQSHPGHIAAIGQSPEDLVHEALDRFGRVDVVVSNDFARPISRGFEDATVTELRLMLDNLLLAPFRLIAAALPSMKAQGSGRVVLVTSGGPCVIRSVRATAPVRPITPRAAAPIR